MLELKMLKGESKLSHRTLSQGFIHSTSRGCLPYVYMHGANRDGDHLGGHGLGEQKHQKTERDKLCMRVTYSVCVCQGL